MSVHKFSTNFDGMTAEQEKEQRAINEKLREPSEGYEFYGFTIPGYMLGHLKEYINTGRGMGDFLTAVVNNDLKRCIDHADMHNRANLPAYVGYLYNKAPGGCWGSPELVKKWKAAGGLEGLEAADED